jgi:hypothetical protein
MEGWSEPAATNAPVADEPVEAVFRMNENPILPAHIYLFFPPLLYPKIFPPPTYHLPTPPPHSITRVPETSSGSELGARELGVGAWSDWSRSEEGNVALQRSGAKEGDGNNAAVAFFFLLCNCNAAPQRRRWQLPLPSSSYCGAVL